MSDTVAPCDTCAYRVKCSEEQLSCRQMLVWMRRGEVRENEPRIPSRLAYYRAERKINTHEVYAIIAEVRRNAVAQGREKQTVAEFAEALNLDEIASFELLEQYARKQAMRHPSEWIVE